MLYSYYQDKKESIHAHPQQRNIQNNRLYNDKSGAIKQSKEAYRQRDKQWTQKEVKSRKNSSECANVGPKHGANMVEGTHSIVNRKCNIVQHKEIHLDFVPAYDQVIIFCANCTNTKTIQKQMKKNPQKYINSPDFSMDHFHELIKIQNSYRGLDPLREKKLDANNHGYLWWPNIDRTMQDKLKGIFIYTYIIYNEIK